MDSSPDWLYEILQNVQLEQFYLPIRDQLQITRLAHFDYVHTEDLEKIGISKPGIRRLQDAVRKKKLQLWNRKFWNKLFGSSSSVTREKTEVVRPQALTDSRTTCIILEKDVMLHNELGNGSFGVVKRGEWKVSDQVMVPVAVKVLKDDAFSQPGVYEDFQREVEAMHSLKHPNLIKLHGVVFYPLMMVCELAPMGALLDYIRAQNGKVSLNYITKWSGQVAAGMAHLERNRFLHRDLACRNILLTNLELVKIGDFGLMRALPDADDCYVMSERRKVPFPWCAPESLRSRQFSHASDVWMFAVALWEMYSFGEDPWMGLNGSEILRLIMREGQRLPAPTACPPDVYMLMMQCWDLNPKERPSFEGIQRFMETNKFDTAIANLSYRKHGQMTIEAGDTIVCIDKRPELHWWKGQNQRTLEVGLFPSTLVTIVKSKKSVEVTKKSQTVSPVRKVSQPTNGFQEDPEVILRKRRTIESTQPTSTRAGNTASKHFNYNKLINDRTLHMADRMSRSDRDHHSKSLNQVKEDLLIDIDLPPCTVKTTPTKKPPNQTISLLDEPIDVPEIDVMGRMCWREALWALVLLCTLAPSHADGNIGCLFSSSLCMEGVEWCYDDFAFGKCIPAYDGDPEEGALYQYDMSSSQLQWFERELQQLATRGYRWEHAYTQCVLQSMLNALRRHLNPANVNSKLCDHFIDPKLNTAPPGEGEENIEIEPDETAYVRFTPNSQLSDSDYANEVYNPPFTPDEDPSTYVTQGQVPIVDEELESEDTPSDKLRNLMLMTGIEESPVIMPFEGFRERIQAEEMARNHDARGSVPNEFVDKEKKSLAETKLERPSSDNDFKDEERLGAHFRQFKTKPPPNTAEYLFGNQFSPLDAEVRSNALEKYKQSFAEKNFPFEYENPGDIPEPRVYYEEDGSDEFPIDAGSGELDSYHGKDSNTKLRNPKYMEYLMNYWREITAARLNAKENMYAEGGPLKPDELQAQKSTNQQHPNKPNHNHNDFDYDPSYAFVTFHNRFLTDWAKGMSFIERLEQMLGLEKNTFTNPRVDPYEVTFKVEKNTKGYDATEVGKRIDAIKDQVRIETGAQIDTIGIGDRSKHPVISHPIVQEPRLFGLSLPVLFALIGSMSVLIVGAVIVAVMLRHDIMGSKRKMQGLASAAEIDAEATRDYQELCRARMLGKWTGQQTAAAPPHPAEDRPPQRITSLSREPDGNSPSTRSSTSSWSEEPALTNMDISTGHMVLAYMEDHLRNKDRLEQEWRALCAYEAEPCATVAALKPENNGKNRYADLLPYDHSRVTLNTLSNHLGSDYINASTITDHDPRNPAYIAAAGPLPHTAPDFWQMVWEQGSVVMVMLTRLTENGQQLCHRYWPEEGSELYHIYEVHLVSEHIWCDDYLVRSFYLKNQRTGETRTVTQFHFLSWPENGVPSSTKALLEFRRKVNKSYRGRSCPIVVHCSDGAGRTGTYCLIDMVLNRMAKGAKEIDIAATLEHIRDQRPRTVATKQQFEFVLMAVAEEVHAILKALPAHLQQLQEKKEKDKEKEKEKEGTEKEKPN